MMIRKCSLLLTAILLTLTIHAQKNNDVVWDKEIKVETGMQTFGDVKFPAYSVPIYEVPEKKVTKDMLNTLVEGKHSKVSVKKGVLMAEAASVPAIGSDPIDVYATYDRDKKNDAVIMHLAFLRNGVALNPDDHPAEHRKAEETVRRLGLDLNRAVVQGQVEEQEKILEKMEKDLDKLNKESKNLEKDADKAKKNLSSAENDQRQDEQELLAKRQELEAMKLQAGMNPTEEQAKEMAKLNKSIDKLEKKIDKLIKAEEKYEKNMTKAGDAAPKTQKDINDLTKEISEQKKLVDQYRKKLAAIK